MTLLEAQDYACRELLRQAVATDSVCSLQTRECVMEILKRCSTMDEIGNELHRLCRAASAEIA